MASRLIGLAKGHQGGSNSVVECHPSKVDVAGSNPVSRSIFSPETVVAADLRMPTFFKNSIEVGIAPISIIHVDILMNWCRSSLLKKQPITWKFILPASQLNLPTQQRRN
jgi:hypothetical protein